MMTVRSLSKSSLLGLLLLTGCICICIQVTAAAAPTPRFTVAKSKMAKELDHRTPHRHQLHLDAEQEEGTFTAHGLSHKASDIIRKDDDDNDNDEIMECQDEAASLLLLDKGDKDQEAQTSTASSSLLIARGGAGRGRGGLTEAEPSVSASVLERLKIGFYFALWYALNVVYNIKNKHVLNVLPAPYVVGSIQLGVGALYVAILWMFQLRSRPKLSGSKARIAVQTVGLWHSIGQICSMVSLGAGPVSFTHIVKALEPLFSALVSALYFGKWMHPVVYSTLIPVVGGVGYACLKERSFTWLAFMSAMGSNLAFALRAVLSKMAMNRGDSGEDSIGTNVTAPNMFGLVTCAAFWISIPFAFVMEGQQFFFSAGRIADPDTLLIVQLPSLWQTAAESFEKGTTGLVQAIILSGLFHYLNNEVMYLALSNVHPVTLAVGNTMKRVFIIISSVIAFGTPINLQTGIGSAIGISGVLLYSLTKQYYESLEKEQESKKGSTIKAKTVTKVKAVRKQASRAK